MYLGDNLLQGGISDLVAAFREHGPDALILLTPVPDPENYGVAELAPAAPARSAGWCAWWRSPHEPATDLALVGVYMFTAGVHDAARAIAPSPRGELEITDAIQHLVDSGLRVEPHVVRGWWKDTGRLEDMLEANRLILDNLRERIEGELIDSQVDGRVVIERGARLERTTVRGPAIVGADARLSDCYIGPYTAIGERCSISGSEVEHSILLAGCKRVRPRRAHGVLAAGAQRDGAPRRPPAARVPLHGRRQLRHLDPVRLLVTGAAGMLGLDVLRAGERAGHELVGVDLPELDITDAGSGAGGVCADRPDAALNCAAWTDVDGAETHAEQAHAVNADGAGNLARAAAQAGVPLVHVSTDYVFDGEACVDGSGAPRAYVESDPTGPRSVYGQSKLAGEQQVLAASPRHAVVRSAWLFGTGGRNFAADDAEARGRARRGAGGDRPGRLPDVDRPPRAGAARADRARGRRSRAPRGRRSRLLERLRRGDLPPGRGRLPRGGGHHRGDAAPGARARRGRRSSQSATMCCRCRRGRTGSRATWRRGPGSSARARELARVFGAAAGMMRA